jgi:hypothetical protein
VFCTVICDLIAHFRPIAVFRTVICDLIAHFRPIAVFRTVICDLTAHFRPIAVCYTVICDVSQSLRLENWMRNKARKKLVSITYLTVSIRDDFVARIV